MAKMKSEIMSISLCIHDGDLFYKETNIRTVLIIFFLMMNYSINYTKCLVIFAKVEEDQ